MSELIASSISENDLSDDKRLFKVLQKMNNGVVIMERIGGRAGIDLEGLGLCVLYIPDDDEDNIKVDGFPNRYVVELTEVGLQYMEELRPKPVILEKEIKALSHVHAADKSRFSINAIQIGEGSITATDGRMLMRIEREDLKYLKPSLVMGKTCLHLFKAIEKQKGESNKSLESDKLIDMVNNLDQPINGRFPDTLEVVEKIKKRHEEKPGFEACLSISTLTKMLKAFKELGTTAVKIKASSYSDEAYIMVDANPDNGNGNDTKNVIGVITPVTVYK